MPGQSYKSKQDSSFKCVIWYKNGFTGVYYSRDWKHGRFRPDLGLEALEKLVEERAAKSRHVMIWDKRDGRDLLIRERGASENGWKVRSEVQF